MSEPRGRPLKLDPNAVSANPNEPAFIARPAGAPVYHGFHVTEFVYEGFTLGEITSFAESPDSGDAFLIAPDGSRCGLIWQLSAETYVDVCMEPTPDRWGVWNVWLAKPMSTPENIVENLRIIVTQLKSKWEAWRAT